MLSVGTVLLVYTQIPRHVINIRIYTNIHTGIFNSHIFNSHTTHMIETQVVKSHILAHFRVNVVFSLCFYTHTHTRYISEAYFKVENFC